MVDKRVLIITGLLIIISNSCMNLDDMNINPNGVDPSKGNPNLLLSSIETYIGTTVVNLGFGDIAGVMQHTQKDGWSGSHNSYNWTTSDHNWGDYYKILRNIDEMYDKSVEMELDFHQGAALVLRAYVFGLITDLWGDAPYSQALKGDLGGEENIKPVFDKQEDIYTGILADLDAANTLLSGKQSEYFSISPVQDLFLGGDVNKWQKFANSLALRYYMRLSEKAPSVAQAGITTILADPDTYPIMEDASDDVNLSYYGNSEIDAWPTDTTNHGFKQGAYARLKMCATLVEPMQTYNDPRLPLWAEKVDIPLVAVASPAARDDIVDSVRYIGPDVVSEYESLHGVPIDFDPEYVGFPPAWSAVAQAYNLCPDINQAPHNPHASHLNKRYMNTDGPLLKARILTAAEVNFIIAEAALKGWASDPQGHYEQGIQASLDAWGVGSEGAAYILNPGVVYDGTLEQIMEQKWIASWTATAESWFDFRRTGLPGLLPGTVVKRNAIPLRFYYGVDELNYNPDNTNAAINLLEETAYSMEDGKNSAWSKMWVLQ
ncbi:MAG: SusD/RagB family nutrient-binding outer membrane lipoprotein [Bacteroidota bacterium]